MNLKEQIKEMIQSHKEWEFMYIGADIDSYSEGQSIGINSFNISNYKKMFEIYQKCLKRCL